MGNRRTRSKQISTEIPTESKEEISADERWRVALDICSVRALKGAFDACREDDGYDMGEFSYLDAYRETLAID